MFSETTIREDNPRVRRPPPMDDDPELQVYDPFGHGGSGAPLRDDKGKVITNIYGKMAQCNPVRHAVLSVGSYTLSIVQIMSTKHLKRLLFLRALCIR